MEYVDKILALPRRAAVSVLGYYGKDLPTDDFIEIDDEEEFEAIVLSFMTSITREDMLTQELIEAFPEAEDIIEFLLESTSFQVTPSTYSQLLELQEETMGRTTDRTICLQVDNLLMALSFPRRASVGALMVVVDQSQDDNDNKFKCIVMNDHFATAVLHLREFGLHRWTLSFSSPGRTLSGHTLVTSPVYDYALAVDGLFDVLYWQWSYTGVWTAELESSLLELVVSVNEELEEAVRSWKPMMSMIGGAAQETNKMIDSIRNDVTAVLSTQSKLSMGRLHQALVQLQDSGGGILNLPEVFRAAVETFLRAKANATPAASTISALREAAGVSMAYVMQLPHEAQLEAQRVWKFYNTIQPFLSPLDNEIGDGLWHYEYKYVECIGELRAKPMEMFMGGMAGSTALDTLSSSIPRQQKVSYLPVLTNEDFASPAHLDMKASMLCESLTMDAIQIGSILGTKIGPENVSFGCTMVTMLLDAGIAYVTGTGGKLIGLLNMKRSALHIGKGPPTWIEDDIVHGLIRSRNGGAEDVANAKIQLVTGQDAAGSKGSKGANAKSRKSQASSAKRGGKDTDTKEPTNVQHGVGAGTVEGSLEDEEGALRYHKTRTFLPQTLAKRLKDLPRIFRQKLPKDSPTQLKLTSDLGLAIEKLRAHHGQDCWVDSELEAVWRRMAAVSPPQLLVFELWISGELVAADFAHPAAGGAAVYVATRFFERENPIFRQCQPGFLLAFAECKVLSHCGCQLWDLGGYDLNPLMQYKLDLTGKPLERPVALHAFRTARQRAVVGESASACEEEQNGSPIDPNNTGNDCGQYSSISADGGSSSRRCENGVSGDANIPPTNSYEKLRSMADLTSGMVLMEEIRQGDMYGYKELVSEGLYVFN